MLLRLKDPVKETTWDVMRILSDKIGQQLIDSKRSVAKEDTSLEGLVDQINFNATTHGQRDIGNDRLSSDSFVLRNAPERQAPNRYASL